MSTNKSEEETYRVTMDAEITMDVDVTDGVPEVMQAASEVEGKTFTLKTETGQEFTVDVGQVSANDKIGTSQ